MQDARAEKDGNLQLRRRVRNFSTCLRNFRTSADFSHQFRTGAKFSHSTAAPFCFAHNVFIRTLFWVILVPLERLKSVESKYSIKNTF